MASIEEVDNRLTDVSKELVRTPYAVANGILQMSVILEATQKIVEGQEMLAGLMGPQANYERTAMGAIAAQASKSTREVTNAATIPGRDPHPDIQSTLAGLTEMHDKAGEFDQNAAVMGDSLRAALGHLAGFGTRMVEYTTAVAAAHVAVTDSYAGCAQAVDGIRDYVMGH